MTPAIKSLKTFYPITYNKIPHPRQYFWLHQILKLIYEKNAHPHVFKSANMKKEHKN